MKDFRSLTVWQKAHEVALSIYKATQLFPQQETYGLTSQIQRSASSVAANIAEGCGCNGNREFARFLGIALRSASETEYFLLLVRDLTYLESETYTTLNIQVVEVKRMLTAFIKKLNTDS
jgi:four helix bundle protein